MSKMSLRALPVPISLGALCLAALTTAAAAQVAEVSAIWTPVPTTASPLQFITVKAPSAGNMIVTAAGQVNYAHAQGTQTYWCVALSLTSGDVGGCAASAGSSAAAQNYVSSSLRSSDRSYGTMQTYSIVHVYPVTSGTVYKFYLNGLVLGSSLSQLFQASLTAQFSPGT